MWLSSISLYLVGTEQVNSYSIRTAFDSIRKFSHLRKTIACSLEGMFECYGDIPHDVPAWTLPDTVNSDWLDKQGKLVLSVTGNRYCVYFRKYILLQTQHLFVLFISGSPRSQHWVSSKYFQHSLSSCSSWHVIIFGRFSSRVGKIGCLHALRIW